MIFALLFTQVISHSQNVKNSEKFIMSYRSDYHSIIVFKRIPNNYSIIHYKPNFSKEQFPLKNHKPFGAFFPYGGLIKFDEPISQDNIICVQIPHECRNIYISTLSDSFFRIGTPPSNATFEKNLKICLLNFGNPSEINIKMNTESFSKLSFISIDNLRTPKNSYSGNLSFTEHFNESSLLFFQTTYFYLNNFVNITINQISSIMNIEPHTAFISKSSLNGSFGLLLEDPIDSLQGDEMPNSFEDIKPTFHHQIKANKNYNSHTYDENYESSYSLDHEDDDYSSDNNILVKLIVISVFMICGAILLGCCGLLCIGCYSCTNKANKSANRSSPNKEINNCLLLNQDTNFDDAIPPTIPQPQNQYFQQQCYPSNNYQQTYYYIQNDHRYQPNYSINPTIMQQNQRYQYTD